MDTLGIRPTKHSFVFIVFIKPPPTLFLLRLATLRTGLLVARLLLFGLLLGGTLLACQVPVFRYALERWESDAYQLVCVPAEGGWKPLEEAALEALRAAISTSDFPANLSVRVQEDGKNDGKSARWELHYPRELNRDVNQPIWVGDATIENANRILRSPVRQNLIHQILTGKSAVWIFVESGDPAKDNAAVNSLMEYAKNASERLELPEGVIGMNDTERLENLAAGDQENILQSDVPLKVDFSVLRISRRDPAEEVFLQMLLNLEPDLDEYADHPMAFPIFGRGRALEPLIGLGLTDDNVWAHSTYLTGACSCEAKDQNPGIDLLMAMDWNAAMEGSQVIIDKLLPPLEGTAALTRAGDSVSNRGKDAPEATFHAAPNQSEKTTENEGISETSPHHEKGLPLRPLVLVLAAVIVVLGAGTMILKKGASGK